MQIRATVDELLRRHGCSTVQASRLLRRHPGYIRRFIREGRPERLSRPDAELLSRFLGVHERELGVLPNDGGRSG